jgi:hypothetical protein
MPSLPLACLQVIYTSSRSDEEFLEALRKPSISDASEPPHEVWHSLSGLSELKHVEFLAEIERTEALHLTQLHKGLASGTKCTSRSLKDWDVRIQNPSEEAQVHQYQLHAL